MLSFTSGLLLGIVGGFIIAYAMIAPKLDYLDYQLKELVKLLMEGKYD